MKSSKLKCRTMKIKNILVACFFITSISISAQQFTMEECIETALQHGQSIPVHVLQLVYHMLLPYMHN